MIAVLMVQASIDQIIHVVAMRDRLVTASRAVLMRRIVSAGAVLRRAAVGVRGSDFDHVFVDTAVIHMLQVTVVEVIDVALMPNRDMTAVRPVDVLIGATGTIAEGMFFPFLITVTVDSSV